MFFLKGDSLTLLLAQIIKVNLSPEEIGQLHVQIKATYHLPIKKMRYTKYFIVSSILFFLIFVNVESRNTI